MKKNLYSSLVATLIAMPLQANKVRIEESPTLKATVTNKSKQPQLI